MATDEAVAQFVAFSGAGPDEARQYIEMAGGSVEQAVNLFLEMGGGGGGAAASPPSGPSPAPAAPPGIGTGGGGGGGVVDADVAAEVAAAAAAAGIDVGAHSAAPDVPMEEAEVRAPIAAYEDQIINPRVEQRRQQEQIAADAAEMARRMSFDRSDDAAPTAAGRDDGSTGTMAVDSTGNGASGQAINQLFAAPSFNNTRPYYEVREEAQKEGKWILVNIQQAEVFASHQLNRDVWNDDTIKDIVMGSFIFWQRDDKSKEGQQFCSYYNCGHQLPHICIVDPRTGRRMKNWDGRKWIESHAAAEYLFGFLDEFSMSRPPVASPSGSPSMSPNMSPSGSPRPEGAGAPAGGGGDMEMIGLPEADGPNAAGTGEAADEPMEEPAEPIAKLPDEPADGEGVIKVSLRLPSGSRVTRRFLAADKLEQMFIVASALSEQPVSRIDLSTQFPKRSLREVDGGMEICLKDAQVAGNMVMVSNRAA
eukprot:gnl/TRDRNA2_/TRDRNA2_128936_c0_seq1.p1 gnl/TRDRNA2_/TRDRNA2_128936_c0~~gnl/TRDRNA2_/TRDRNA2_128936_c0_seq1.p1  ORF type:complete len:500 (+),score=104.59 gnl/TRDRNA2_/TRDRNA2_128936_c0_seq1:68-1501(+)